MNMTDELSQKSNPSRRWGLDANMLRGLAVLFMLVDHLWGTLVVGNNWMTHLGRLAFPIFAFQIAQGYLHTSNVKKYALRLLILAAVAEVPFNLMGFGEVLYPFSQNVVWTLLLGLLAIRQTDRLFFGKGGKKEKWKAGLLLLGILLLSVVGFPNYGIRGVVMVLGFYLIALLPIVKWPFWLILLVLTNIVGFEGWQLSVTAFGREFFMPQQSFAVLAFIPICLYNGQNGVKNRILQYGFYVFYPLHMLILWFIAVCVL